MDMFSEVAPRYAGAHEVNSQEVSLCHCLQCRYQAEERVCFGTAWLHEVWTSWYIVAG